MILAVLVAKTLWAGALAGMSWGLPRIGKLGRTVWAGVSYSLSTEGRTSVCDWLISANRAPGRAAICAAGNRHVRILLTTFMFLVIGVGLWAGLVRGPGTVAEVGPDISSDPVANAVAMDYAASSDIEPLFPDPHNEG